MKKIIAIVIVLVFTIQYGLTQPAGTDGKQKPDSNKEKSATPTAQKPDTAAQTPDIPPVKPANPSALKPDTSKEGQANTTSSQDTAAKKGCNCVYHLQEVSSGDFGKWAIILSPFFLLILVVLIIQDRLKDFKFTDALTENEPPKKIIKNPEYNAAVIAANANIPNLSILFPTTIEVSNIPPTLTDLKEIVASKDAAIQALEIALAAAKNSKPDLEKTVNDTQTKLDELNGKTAALIDAITSATAEKDAAQDEAAKTAADSKLNDATIALNTNNSAIEAARKEFDDADQKTKSNDAQILSLPGQIGNANQDAADARKNIDVFQKLMADGTLFSPTTYRPSISRYIAFISSLVIILIAVCMSSFFIYHYIRTGCPPEFGALTGMLIALGLGVTPYITNKITTAATTNQS